MKAPSMKSSSNGVVLFLNNFRKSVLRKKRKETYTYEYSLPPLTPLESYFILDFYKGSITSHKGLSGLLGISEENIDIANVISHFHPDDSKLVQTIIEDGCGQILKLKVPKGINIMKLSFRFIKSDGEEIRVLSETIVYSNSFDRKVQTALVKFTKIDFLDSSPFVEWWFNQEYLSSSSVQQKLDNGKENIFSEREFEVVKGIVSNESSAQIADRLNLSQHTIISHRKNIFSKSNSHNIEQLKLYCLKRRLISPKVLT